MTYAIASMPPHSSQSHLAERMMRGVPIQRSSWQGIAAPSAAFEMRNVLIEFLVPDSLSQWQEQCQADLPWAEEHFQERVSGQPLNPPPSSARWPWYSESQRQKFLNGEAQRFDHTYPERYWPDRMDNCINDWGADYLDGAGNLADVAKLLRRDPWTRQAYLPVWFPEDTGAVNGQRVPCTLGYHFIRNGPQLDCSYFLRSCDLTRHYKNDIYLTGRLLQWMVEQVQAKDGLPYAGTLTIFISNLHLFTQDQWRFQ
ncbi:thymidylate synthase [Mycobacterium phage JacoRen57]|nr:thymidylate synthase [Mycobacterium phage JacoRen57]